MAVTPDRPGLSDRELDHRAGADDALVPSSGFSASVMERIRAEAAAPPPIPFPWKRALPGLVVMAFALVAAGVNGSDANVDQALSLEIAFGSLDPALTLALAVTASSCALTFVVVRGYGLFALRSYGASSRNGRPLP